MFNTADGGFLLQSLLLSKSLDQLKRLSLVSRVFSVTPVNRVNNIQLALSASIIRMPSYIFMFSEPHISSPSGFGENFTRTHKIHNRKHVDAGFIHPIPDIRNRFVPAKMFHITENSIKVETFQIAPKSKLVGTKSSNLGRR